jgi:hypothetical protein
MNMPVLDPDSCVLRLDIIFAFSTNLRLVVSFHLLHGMVSLFLTVDQPVYLGLLQRLF